MLHFLVHGEEDNVAVAVVDVTAGNAANCLDMETGARFELEPTMSIPLGHKVALQDLNEGDTVIKYGHDIGRVVATIHRGEHVHVHNLKTKRW